MIFAQKEGFLARIEEPFFKPLTHIINLNIMIIRLSNGLIENQIRECGRR